MNTLLCCIQRKKIMHLIRLLQVCHCDTLFLTNSFCGLERDIASIDEHYDAVLMFGVAPELRDTVRIETCALYIGEYITTDFEIGSLTRELKQCGVPCFVSDKPTSYLCNAAYYHILKKNTQHRFIHISPSNMRIAR